MGQGLVPSSLDHLHDCQLRDLLTLRGVLEALLHEAGL